MAWQPEVGSGSARATSYHDFLTKLTQFACSQHVATVTPNGAGTGYTVGDVLTYTHASAHLDARFEVTSVGGSGEVTGLRIIASGAFAQQAVSATVSAGGSNYAVNDVLRVDGGSARIPAKFQVATLSGSAVATVNLFEGGGAYSSTPSNPAATTKIGPTAGTGSGCTLTVTYQSITGTTGLSVTGGTGSGETIDITLAETGWSVDGRDHNNHTFNSITNEKQVVLVGDATGRTNKPYVGFSTFTQTSGINTRYHMALVGLIAHNPNLALSAQVNQLGDPGTYSTDRPYVIFDENDVQDMDFWFSVDDLRIVAIHNLNSGAASTDNGQYIHTYAGFMDTFATESENPYPYFIGTSCRQSNLDPSASSINISGMGECLAPTAANSGWWYYRVETSTWVSVFNSQNFSTTQQTTDWMFPMAKGRVPDSTASATVPYYITEEGVLTFYTGIGSQGRGSATRRLLPIPGSTPAFFPIPLSVNSRPGGSTNNFTLDMPRGQLRGCFWIYNTDASAATITNFSEDYITIGSNRYRVFHNHVQTAIYQFICIKEDV